jgi:hypothetical protein
MGNSLGNKATAGVLLERTSHPGVYRRGGRQRKEFAATFVEARTIKVERDAEAREERRGPTLHAYALAWIARHAGSGRDAVREQTRTEYQRLLATFALSYFPRASGSATSIAGPCRLHRVAHRSSGSKRAALRPLDPQCVDAVTPLSGGCGQ